MTTTALFVELLVVGAGTLEWLFLLVLVVFGYRWLPQWHGPDTLLLFITLSSAYLLGIVIDRISNRIFRKWAWHIRRGYFKQPGDYHLARVAARRDAAIFGLFEYGRSRLRICRGWALNAGLTFVLSQLLIWLQVPSSAPRLRLSLMLAGSLAALTISCVYGWFNLCSREAEHLARLPETHSILPAQSETTP